MDVELTLTDGSIHMIEDVISINLENDIDILVIESYILPTYDTCMQNIKFSDVVEINITNNSIKKNQKYN